MLTWGPQELLAHSVTEIVELGVGWEVCILSETCWCRVSQ